MMEKWATDFFYWSGVAALIPQGWLNIMSIGPIRFAAHFFRRQNP